MLSVPCNVSMAASFRNPLIFSSFLWLFISPYSFILAVPFSILNSCPLHRLLQIPVKLSLSSSFFIVFFILFNSFLYLILIFSPVLLCDVFFPSFYSWLYFRQFSIDSLVYVVYVVYLPPPILIYHIPIYFFSFKHFFWPTSLLKLLIAICFSICFHYYLSS